MPPGDAASTPGGAGDSTDGGGPLRIEQAALLAAGVLAIVGIARRQRLRSARPRHRTPEPPPSVRDTERRLRSIDGGERSERVDVAVRAIAAAIVGSGQRVGLVTVDDTGDIEVRLTGAAELPGPWTGSGSSWHLGADVPIELLAPAARQVDMPCVALVQVGLTPDGRQVLVDLEACGHLAVAASDGVADRVVRALALGLASSVHAEVAHFVYAGVDEDALLGHRNAHRVDDAETALQLAADLVGSTAAVDVTTFELRSRRTGGEVWEPAIVLLASGHRVPDEFDSVDVGVAVVSAGAPVNAPATLAADDDRWRLNAFGDSIELRPVAVDDEELDAVTELVEHARRDLVEVTELRWADDAPTGNETAEEPAEGHRADGDQVGSGAAAHRADVTRAGVDARARFAADDPQLDVPQPDDPQLDDARLDNPRPGDPETGELEPAADRVGATPPAATVADREHAIVVGVLGDVTVTAADGSAGHFERSKTVELIAWLATHRDRSTRSAARTALWEVDVRDATFANVVSEARRGLARLVAPPDGDEWIPRTLSDSLPLHELVVTDADLVADRLDRARVEPPAQALVSLRPAVALIRDLPFAGTNYLWPDAEGITSNLVLLAIGAATEYAGHALSLGDTDGVFWATGQGLRVLPGHEELVGLRMQAHARAGDLAGVRQEWASYERVLTADPWSDGEPAAKLVELRRSLLAADAQPNS